LVDGDGSPKCPILSGTCQGGEIAHCGDLLLGLGEVVGCGNRHSTAEQVLRALEQHMVDPAEYKWYVEMRKLKQLQTTGWGIGSERFLAWVLQHDGVRDIQLLPRLKGMECVP
jgi:asparaginyl-tRNA synthetase